VTGVLHGLIDCGYACRAVPLATMSAPPMTLGTVATGERGRFRLDLAAAISTKICLAYGVQLTV
jgi:hypothetical protein